MEDPGEIAIRESFDTLLEFFCKLEYLLQVRLITDNEMAYFDYYFKICKDLDSLNKYVLYYPLPLYQKLVKRYEYSSLPLYRKAVKRHEFTQVLNA
jgi:hypothetical protein